MLNKKIKSASVLISAMLLMTACGTTVNTITNPANTGSVATNNSSTISSPSNLTFSKVSEAKVAEYNNLLTKNVTSNQAQGSGGGVTTQVSPTSPQISAPSPGSAAGISARSSDMAMAPYMSYFPGVGPFEEYTVTDFDEARTTGFSGTYIEALNKIVKPVIKGLGNDARMTSSNGSSDANGINKSDDVQNNNNSGKPEIMPYPINSNYQQYQWQFTYVSSSKKEVYSIFVSTRETLVLKQKWGIKDLSPDDIKIDSNSAIKLISEAIVNRNSISSPPDSQPQYTSPGNETLYEIPKNTSWYLYLEKEKGKLIWNINMNIMNYAQPMPLYDTGTTNAGSAMTKPDLAPIQQPEFWYSGGYARIDAANGNILTLVRPSRYKNVQPSYPEPMPVDSLPNQGSGGPAPTNVGVSSSAQK